MLRILLINALLVLFFSSGHLYAQDIQNSARQLYLDANDLYNSGKYYESASKLITAESLLGNTNSKILFLKAHVYQKLTQKDAAYLTLLNSSLDQFFEITDKTVYPANKYNEMLAIKLGYAPKTELTEATNNKYFQFVSAVIQNMVKVEGGSFLMGTKSLKLADRDARPVHIVNLNTFNICKFDVTLQQFALFTSETGYISDIEKYGSDYSNPQLNWRYNPAGIKYTYDAYNFYPVTFITYNDAIEYCKWLSKISGHHFRLPTEAEWEFAARGGRKTNNYIYSGSNTIGDVAWHDGNSGKVVHPVGQKLPNELGLYDMSGNVYQLCNDWFDLFYYGRSVQDNPQGAEERATLNVKSIRGGCAVSYETYCDNFFRERRPLIKASNFSTFGVEIAWVGFRVVMDN